MTHTELPPLKNRRQFKYVNATPDIGYPIRILKAYLLDAQTEWEIQGMPESKKHIYNEMNKAQAKRREILTVAIKKLLTYKRLIKTKKS